MDEKNCISCIKDAVTGECRNVKDKKARTSIEEIHVKINEIIAFINEMSGVDAGNVAFKTDIQNLQLQITALQTSLNNLDLTYATDEDITNVNNAITSLENSLADVVRTGDITDVVRTGDITDVVRTGDITDVVRTSDIEDVAREGDIVGIEHIDVLYDKTSNDSNKNWGYTSGIQGGVEVTGKDFTKYKALRIYWVLSQGKMTTILSLNNAVKHDIYTDGKNYFIGSAVTLSADKEGCICGLCTVNEAKTSFYNRSTGFFTWTGTTFTDRNASANYYVEKIEGVY